MFGTVGTHVIGTVVVVARYLEAFHSMSGDWVFTKDLIPLALHGVLTARALYTIYQVFAMLLPTPCSLFTSVEAVVSLAI
jgi:hypothetical protein